jgi:hypothetical protein
MNEMDEICSTYGGYEIHTKYLSENGKRTDLLGDLLLVEEDTIKIYFMEAVWMGFIWLRIGSNDICYKHSNEPLALRKSTQFLLNNLQAKDKKIIELKFFAHGQKGECHDLDKFSE